MCMFNMTTSLPYSPLQHPPYLCHLNLSHLHGIFYSWNAAHIHVCGGKHCNIENLPVTTFSEMWFSPRNIYIQQLLTKREGLENTCNVHTELWLAWSLMGLTQTTTIMSSWMPCPQDIIAQYSTPSFTHYILSTFSYSMFSESWKNLNRTGKCCLKQYNECLKEQTLPVSVIFTIFFVCLWFWIICCSKWN